MNSNVQNKLDRFNQTLSEKIEPEFQFKFTASIESDLIRIEVENFPDQSEGKTLMEFTELMRDRLIDSAIEGLLFEVAH